MENGIQEMTEEQMAKVDGGVSNCALGIAILALSGLTLDPAGLLIGGVATAIYC